MECTEAGLSSVPLVEALGDLDPAAVTSMDLSNNNLTSVPDNAFAAYPSLQYLRLSGNRISSVSPQAFEGVKLQNLMPTPSPHSGMPPPLTHSFIPYLPSLDISPPTLRHAKTYPVGHTPFLHTHFPPLSRHAHPSLIPASPPAPALSRHASCSPESFPFLCISTLPSQPAVQAGLKKKDVSSSPPSVDKSSACGRVASFSSFRRYLDNNQLVGLVAGSLPDTLAELSLEDNFFITIPPAVSLIRDLQLL
ncbi:putative leucine-rich repeat-containing G-protein coupled receptor 6 isoform X2 [Penaeus vannamei]|uniref:Putative leucine-rich repeat-containing G-protein coupled receptor 6 isoform X2 n=1 Tax=Penaeus vannamei TaxID=6689 RepID=A0A3R7MJW9_PENVA|nr:putative leucine-rich repeat-containing G-protein coupled receptor 6 isoform X2 [Penaeus vannamei]